MTVVTKQMRERMPVAVLADELYMISLLARRGHLRAWIGGEVTPQRFIERAENLLSLKRRLGVQ